jgi:phospholipid/cholesterol/gamma-HCH transport system substrate-binding protein
MAAFRAQIRWLIAIGVLVVLALGASYVILQNQRVRIPILEERPFELKAEFESTQAVEPGQGQSIRVAGVKVGDVQDVELSGGVAVATFAIDRDYLPIYRDATILMRPQTPLKDQFFELDPGSRGAGEFEEGATVAVSNTLPDINLDQVLSVLDTDSRAYLRLLVVGLGKGLEGRDKDLADALGSLGPINRDLKQLGSAVSARDESLAQLVHNLNTLTGAVGRRDDDLSELVETSNAAFGAVAEQAPDLRAATAQLPKTLAVARETLADTEPFARELGPTLDDLRPLARRLTPVANSTRELAETATPILHNQLRPLARQLNAAAPDLRRSAARFSVATPDLTRAVGKVNELGNMAAYNPRGAEPPGAQGRDEGYLYWLGWFAHNSVTLWSSQDAHGPSRRLFLTASCSNLKGMLDLNPAGPVLGGLLTGFGPLFEPGGECDR